MSILIAIADDHPMVIKGLKVMLEGIKDIRLGSIYSNGNELMEGLKEQKPDVLILDIQMPGMHGDELAPIIMKSFPGIAILTLTNLDQSVHVQKMMDNGALGYLLKSTDQDVLIDAIKTVHAGKQFIDPALRTQVLQDMFAAKKKETSLPSISPRELEILQLIANDNTSQEIADKLFLSKRTVDHHRTSLLLKLESKSASSMVKKAIDLGLIK